MRNRLFAALLGCLTPALPAHAGDLYLSLGIDNGWAKQEMQGLGQSAEAEPHFSLTTQSRDYSIELGKRAAQTIAGRPVSVGVMLIHSGPQTVDATTSPHAWIAQTGRRATTESLSALIVARAALAQGQAGRIEAGIGIGFADTTVQLQDLSGTQTAHETVPQALLALRGVRDIGQGTEIWVETRYLTSPAVQVAYGPDRVIGHETSGWSVGVGITIALK